MTTTTAGRFVRPAIVLLLAGALSLLLAGPGRAAGTGGIEVTPIPGIVDGRQVTAFHVKVPSRGDATVPYALRNTTSAPASARLYVAAAVSDGKGGFSLAGASPYVSMKDATITLQPKEARQATFAVHVGPDGRPNGTAYAAVVVEVRRGSVVQQAATLIYLKAGRTVPLPLLIVLIAVALLALAAVGVLLGRRRR